MSQLLQERENELLQKQERMEKEKAELKKKRQRIKEMASRFYI